jgi:hypothetical protein
MVSLAIDDKNILFAGLTLPEIDREKILFELLKIESRHWIKDSYRCTEMLPVMTQNGRYDRSSLLNIGETLFEQKRDFTWTELAPQTLKEYFEQFIFSWVNPRPRIVILKTKPYQSNNIHIDCTPQEFGSKQLKLRLVVSGRVDSLYFLTQDGEVRPPEIRSPFLIDGSWPHGMHNDYHEDKITSCVGAPWTGSEIYPLFNTLIQKSDYKLPSNFKSYFEKTD